MNQKESERQTYWLRKGICQCKKRSYVFLVTRLEREMDDGWFACQRPVCYYGMSVKSLHRFKCSSIWSLESKIIWGGRIFWTWNLVVRLRVVLMDLYAPNIMPQEPYLFAMFPWYDGFNACEPNVFLSFSRFLLAVGCRT